MKADKADRQSTNETTSIRTSRGSPARDRTRRRPAERDGEAEPATLEFDDHPLLDLQRRVGNRATGRLLEHGIQAKLRVGPSNDRYEREADRVARAVTRLPRSWSGDEGSSVGWETTETATPSIQRLCSRCRRRLRRGQPLDCPDCERTLQRSPSAAGELPTVSDEVAGEIDRVRGAGRPLPPATGAFFESRFGRDFGQVRVHTDDRAAESARAMNARAYTVGSDVVFGAKQYAPDTASGRLLLAHELTHVVQQAGRSSHQATKPTDGDGSTRTRAGQVVDASAHTPVTPDFRQNSPLALQRQVEQERDRSSSLSSERIPELRQLARRPKNFAVGREYQWDPLSEDIKSVVILAMDDYYGPEFTNAFVWFAETGQLETAVGGTLSGRPGTGPPLGMVPLEVRKRNQGLWRRAEYTPRWAGDECETWVGPDGYEATRCLSRQSEPTDIDEVRTAVEEARNLQQSGEPSRAFERLQNSRSAVRRILLEDARRRGLSPGDVDEEHLASQIFDDAYISDDQEVSSFDPLMREWFTLHDMLRSELPSGWPSNDVPEEEASTE